MRYVSIIKEDGKPDNCQQNAGNANHPYRICPPDNLVILLVADIGGQEGQNPLLPIRIFVNIFFQHTVGSGNAVQQFKFPLGEETAVGKQGPFQDSQIPVQDAVVQNLRHQAVFRHIIAVQVYRIPKGAIFQGVLEHIEKTSGIIITDHIQVFKENHFPDCLVAGILDDAVFIKNNHSGVFGIAGRYVGVVLRYQLFFVGEQVLHGKDRFPNPLACQMLEAGMNQHNEACKQGKIHRTGENKASSHPVNSLQFYTPILSRF